jgi:PPOX class probable F420-dependent enzyme
MALDDPKVQRFLATKDVAVLATVQPDGAPLAMAMWFLHDPASLTMISVANLQKVRNLRRDPRVCVVMEAADASGIRGVTIQGRAEFLDADTPDRRALVERFLKKYDPLRGVLEGSRDAARPRDVPDRPEEGAELGLELSGALHQGLVLYQS